MGVPVSVWWFPDSPAVLPISIPFLYIVVPQSVHSMTIALWNQVARPGSKCLTLNCLLRTFTTNLNNRVSIFYNKQFIDSFLWEHLGVKIFQHLEKLQCFVCYSSMWIRTLTQWQLESPCRCWTPLLWTGPWSQTWWPRPRPGHPGPWATASQFRPHCRTRGGSYRPKTPWCLCWQTDCQPSLFLVHFQIQPQTERKTDECVNEME